MVAEDHVEKELDHCLYCDCGTKRQEDCGLRGVHPPPDEESIGSPWGVHGAQKESISIRADDCRVGAGDLAMMEVVVVTYAILPSPLHRGIEQDEVILIVIVLVRRTRKAGNWTRDNDDEEVEVVKVQVPSSK